MVGYSIKYYIDEEEIKKVREDQKNRTKKIFRTKQTIKNCTVAVMKYHLQRRTFIT